MSSPNSENPLCNAFIPMYIYILLHTLRYLYLSIKQIMKKKRKICYLEMIVPCCFIPQARREEEERRLLDVMESKNIHTAVCCGETLVIMTAPYLSLYVCRSENSYCGATEGERGMVGPPIMNSPQQ